MRKVATARMWGWCRYRWYGGAASGGAAQIDMTFRVADPWAVGMVIAMPGHESATWVLERNMLIAAQVRRVAGGGDVVMQPVGNIGLQINLTSPNGEISLLLPEAGVARFLRRTYNLVPIGNEARHVDWDGWLTQLVGPQGGAA